MLSLALPLLLASTSASALSVPPSSRAAADAQPQLAPASLALRHTAHARRAAAGGDELRTWMRSEKAKIETKYVRRAAGKRDGSAVLQDQNLDASYSAVVQVGTPAQDFDLILDTGSSDLWVAGSACATSACDGVTSFATDSSSTFTNLTTDFSITYGSGSAVGYLATDTVTLAGMTQAAQTFAIVTDTDAGLISDPLSGLMGLGFESLASSGAAPWWENVAGSWTNQVFAFRLARFRDVVGAQSTEQEGGFVDFGALNESHYTGDINYIDVTEAAYWQIPCEGMTVQGTDININTTTSSSSSNPFSSGSSSSSGFPQVAVDTGTTLISVPTATAELVFNAIEGSAPVTESGYEGYYTFPCSTEVNLTLTFNGVTYTVDPADFNIGTLVSGSSDCLGGVYGSDLGSGSSVQWIGGGVFLKGVYSIYSSSVSSSPSGARVGFAALADGSTVATGTAGNGTSSTTTGGSSAGFESATLSTLALGLVAVVGAVVAM